MKRIIRGTTYDTDTATEIMITDENHRVVVRLYQTLSGACFFYDEKEQSINPVTPDEAAAWVEGKHQACLIGPEDDDCKKWSIKETVEALRSGHADAAYFRMPSLLKRQIESAAEQAEMSLNSWALRAFERALREKTL